MKMSAKELKLIQEDLKGVATMSHNSVPIVVVRPTQLDIDKYKHVAKGMRGLKKITFLVRPEMEMPE